METKTVLRFALLGSLVVTGAVLGVACGSDTQETPPNIVGDSGTDSSTDSTKPDEGTDTTPPPDGGDTGGDGADTTPWDPDSGTCFPGTASKNIEFLNACTTAACAKYTAKLTKLNPDGTLPALP